MHTATRTLLFAALALLLTGREAVAQAMHLAPAYRPAIRSGETVLEISFGANSSLDKDTEIVIHDGRLVLLIPGKGQETYTLANQTIGQVASAIQARHGTDLVLTVRYPFHSAQYLKEQPIPVKIATSTGTKRAIEAHPGRPEALIGFGAVFTMAEDAGDDEGGLLDQTGFQLDLIGMHQLVRESDSHWIPQVYTQFRLGLNSDQRLNVVSTAETDVDAPVPTADAQFQTAVEEADQVALTGQVEIVWPVVGKTVEFSIVPEAGVSWTRPGAFQFPLLPLGPDRELEPSEDYFDSDIAELALQDLRRTLPLSSYGLTGRLRFLRDDRVAFYAGGGFVRKEVVQRGIRTRRIPGNIIDPDFLRAEVSTPTYPFWRAEFGARLAGVVDVRVDATGPIGDRDITGITVPSDQDRSVNLTQILRLVIVKDFPLTR